MAAIFAVWVLGIEDGFQFLARATVISAVILIAAQLIMAGLDRLVKRGFAIRQDVRDRFPTLEERANRYLPAMRLFLRWAVGVIAALTCWKPGAWTCSVGSIRRSANSWRKAPSASSPWWSWH